MTVRLRCAALAATVFAWPFVIQAQHSVVDRPSHYVRDSRRSFGHTVSDLSASVNHYRRDTRRSDQHAFRDLTIHGTTNRASSPQHDYYGTRQQGNHYRATRYRSYDHAVRDRYGNPYHYSRQSIPRYRPAHQTRRRHP